MEIYAPAKVNSDVAYINSFEQYEKKYQESITDPNKFWLETAKEKISFFKEPKIGYRGNYNDVNYEWFPDAKLNVAYNCIDRHLEKKADKTAIIWAKDEQGEYEYISYAKLYENVNRMANLLKDKGVKKGDRVCIYLPMIPELAYTMLACTKIGAVHSIVFAGFSAEALRGRILDANCKIVITANEGLRGGKAVALKEITDDALAQDKCVDTVIVVNRTETKVNMVEGRDFNYEDEIKKHRAVCPAESMDAEDPLFILYTSGSTGQPKGVLHTTAGYLTYAATTHQYVFDCKDEDVYFCAADIGWVTGHSYIIYGPLANGATTVMFESTPTYPDAGRYWKVCEDLKVSIFYTAPTALRAVAQCGDEWVKKYDRSSLRVLGSVGEPINPEVWKWYYTTVGEEKCSIVDTWWQTETGGILITPLPGATPTKPGSATRPFFGVKPVLVNPETGERLEGNNVEGALCMEQTWPGQARTLYNDHERFIETYFTQYKGLYFTGDGCKRDKDGYYWITGRIDDVLNVSGHRLGTAEIESAIIEHPAIAEAAVVGYPHNIKGVGIYSYVILQNSAKDADMVKVEAEIKDQVREAIGRFAAPDKIHITRGLPKTRSGKVMRRILRKVAANEFDSLGDISTLADPSVVSEIIEERKKQ
jgi:acetyl-CoA synthetase